MAGLEQVQGMSLQQALSPQMQQSLHVLQAPITELRQLVTAQLEENPALEEVPPEPGEQAESGREPEGSLSDEWREAYAQRAISEPWTAEALERRQHFFDSQTRPPTLLEFLEGQLDLDRLNEREQASARVILGNLDGNGYFRGTLEEAAYPVGCTVAEAERVLEKIQSLDPAGVAARDLAECLILQLQRRGRGRGTGLEARIVNGHLEDLARKKFPEIARALKTSTAEVQRAAGAIRDLDPRPGLAFAPDENVVIAPDVTVTEEEGEFVVSLNEDQIPRLRIAGDFRDMTALGGGREARDYLKDKVRGGRFFISCLEQRQQTILAIAKVIVTRQREFFESGPSALKPMTMSQVAAEVGVHETTVSRAVSGKYMATPHGLFEMKFFFTSGYTTGTGESVSNESVRQALSEIIKGENPRKPYSDQDLVTALSERGVPIARRTVAKYREQLGILPSHMRKAF